MRWCNEFAGILEDDGLIRSCREWSRNNRSGGFLGQSDFHDLVPGRDEPFEIDEMDEMDEMRTKQEVGVVFGKRLIVLYGHAPRSEGAGGSSVEGKEGFTHSALSAVTVIYAWP